MTTRVSVRDLRNSTRDVLERVRHDGEVILTSNGEDVAVIRPIRSEWDRLVDRVLDGVPAPRDTGLSDWLDEDDRLSTDDLA